MNLLIHQPLGLGDILWLQPMVNIYISLGYEVYFPISDVYYDMVSGYIEKDHLNWVRESDEFPMKKYYGSPSPEFIGNDVYLPVSFSDKILPNSGIMASKYFWLNMPIVNWHDSFNINRNYEREELLLRKYNLYDEYILINKSFATNPIHREIKFVEKAPVHVMNVQQDKDNGFHLFDWIGALQSAQEIHTVETSICYLIDKYCTEPSLHMYERRHEDGQRTYFNSVNLVYRNPGWIYEN
jgi:hypothetical protein